MKNNEIKSTLLKYVQQIKQTTLTDAAAKTKIPLIKAQWAAKVLEEEKHITSEKKDKDKILRPFEKQSVATAKVEAAKTETTGEKKEEKTEKPKPIAKKGRDTTKYVFEKSEPLPKGQCALAILKACMRDKKPILKDLKAAFDDNIVQRYGITQNLSDAKALSSDRDRYFLKDAQLLVTKDGKKLAVTSQWTTERFEAFLKLAKKVGYSVKPVA